MISVRLGASETTRTEWEADDGAGFCGAAGPHPATSMAISPALTKRHACPGEKRVALVDALCMLVVTSKWKGRIGADNLRPTPA
jgi:hypothetical protein